ncbi:hypothetical protein PVAP13_8KG330801 [Panicum virgatum]|uniref:Uncharacterized protein n=1 Tax=Panicum virgatum TaxID=38727 RepID=A0A8T0PMP8_PANVG|nr:hypothetical protein PVAP13_8KG330801 [Panicum virgatum]
MPASHNSGGPDNAVAVAVTGTQVSRALGGAAGEGATAAAACARAHCRVSLIGGGGGKPCASEGHPEVRSKGPKGDQGIGVPWSSAAHTREVEVECLEEFESGVTGSDGTRQCNRRPWPTRRRRWARTASPRPPSTRTSWAASRLRHACRHPLARPHHAPPSPRPRPRHAAIPSPRRPFLAAPRGPFIAAPCLDALPHRSSPALASTPFLDADLSCTPSSPQFFAVDPSCIPLLAAPKIWAPPRPPPQDLRHSERRLSKRRPSPWLSERRPSPWLSMTLSHASELRPTMDGDGYDGNDWASQNSSANAWNGAPTRGAAPTKLPLPAASSTSTRKQRQWRSFQD